MFGSGTVGSSGNMIVVDFAEPMIITDLFNAGGQGSKLQFWAVDPNLDPVAFG